jgi:hypothetical protein
MEDAFSRTSRIAREAVAEGRSSGWFDVVYREAGGDPGQVPWADLEPSPGLDRWLADTPPARANAVVVGCGLGDDAEAVAAAGVAAVTAFDISPTAIDWCRRRFPASPVRYLQADLLNPPGELAAGFDLVVESRTVQAFPPDRRDDVCAAIARLVAPGGALWVFQQLWEEPADPQGPPWPLRRSDLGRFTRLGLDETRYERWRREVGVDGGPQLAAEFRRAGAVGGGGRS